MANKLKNLVVTSVDLVDQGANPDAHIQLFKRDTGQPEQTEEEGDGVQKGAKMFAETLSRESLQQITSEMFDFCYALSDSLSSILCDKDLTADSKQAMMTQSLKEFSEAMGVAVPEWAKGNKAKTKAQATNREAAGVQKSEAQQAAERSLLEKRGLLDTGDGTGRTTEVTKTEKEECDTMRIDKSKMTKEELAMLEGFEKKYGVSEPEGNPTPDGVTKGAEGEGNEPTPDTVGKGADPKTDPAAGAGSNTLHPDVQKALSDMRAAYDAQTKQMEALQKSLEIERLTQVAKKYEPLGKKADELAAKMYDLKKAGGTVYDDYIALLDENLALIGKSGLFREIGSNMQGTAGAADTIGIKASEFTKSAGGGLTQAEAIIKAFEENPELAAQYEQEYRRG